jgi:hypothetical protein
MTMLEGERTFVTVPLITKFKFFVSISFPEDNDTSKKLKTINTRASPIFKKITLKHVVTALRNSFG